jgi:transposase
MYKRAIKIKLFATETKKRKINALIHAYRKAVNFFLKSFEENPGKLDKDTLARLTETKLSQRFKSNALKQALGIYRGCKKTKKKVPFFQGFPCLDAKFVTLEDGEKGCFDFWLKLSCLSKGKKLSLPLKKHKRMNYWLKKGTLIQGCELRNDSIIVWVKVEETAKDGERSCLGIDIGMNKLITTSEGNKICRFSEGILSKIARKKKNSKAYKRALLERDNVTNRSVNKINWGKISVLCYENLKNMKRGRSKNRSRGFMSKQKHWSYRKVITRVLEKCQENSVCPVHSFLPPGSHYIVDAWSQSE